jgi:hypothetical protein
MGIITGHTPARSGGKGFFRPQLTDEEHEERMKLFRGINRSFNAVKNGPSNLMHSVRGTPMAISSITLTYCEGCKFPTIRHCDGAQKLVDVDRYSPIHALFINNDKKGFIKQYKISREKPLEDGDELQSINNVNTWGLPKIKVDKLLKGYFNTDVTLVVYRSEPNIFLKVSVKLDRVIHAGLTTSCPMCYH